jgi:hypothetical protein
MIRTTVQLACVSLLFTLFPINIQGQQVSKRPATQEAALSPPVELPEVRVWVNRSSGVYHCPGTRYYGVTKRGAFMSEAQAQKSGNRPAQGRICDPTLLESSSQITDQGSRYSGDNKSVRSDATEVKVWVNQLSHVYHCPGTRYYGSTKRGQFMSQSEAVASGNRPAYGRRCT